MALQAAGGKAVSLVGQLILAYLLLPEHFGLIGLAYTVTGFASLLQRAGIVDVLIRRSERFARWANASFWMSGGLGFLSAYVMVVVAPFAAVAYEAPEVQYLLFWLAVAAPITTFATVPTARLQSQLRFRAYASVEFGKAVGTITLTVLFAALGLEVYSFVLPIPIIAIARTTVLWWLAPAPIRWNPQLRRWRYLVLDSGLVFGATIATAIVAQGATIVLGLMHVPKQTIGVYYFAYNLSLQTILVLTLALGNVLFPALASLAHDVPRQVNAFLRAARLLAVLGIPLCALQAAMTRPAFLAVLEPKWEPAIPVLIALSIGMILRILAFPSISLLKAQGRFVAYFSLFAALAVVFLVLVWAGGTFGLANGYPVEVSVAIAVSLYGALMTGMTMWMGIRASGEGWGAVLSVFARPVLASTLSVGPAWLLSMLLPDTTFGHWTALVLIGGLSVTLYVPIIRWLAPLEWSELMGRVKAFRSPSADR
jgi:O-antigen/teichoic acid export membrane protein